MSDRTIKILTDQFTKKKRLVIDMEVVDTDTWIFIEDLVVDVSDAGVKIGEMILWLTLGSKEA